MNPPFHSGILLRVKTDAAGGAASPLAAGGAHGVTRATHSRGNLAPPKLSRLSPILLCGLLACSVPRLALQAAEAFTVEPSGNATAWTVKYTGRPVMVYAFRPDTFEPYVQQLCTIDGDNVLRDAPHDHLHHHALMYAISVNGLNFWEELSGSGVEKPVQTFPPELGKTVDGLPQARLKQTLHWLAPQDAFLPNDPKHALLVEQRTLTLTIDPAGKEVALEWTSDFAVGGKTNVVTLAGANYFGLGMRFLEELDPMVTHLNAGGPPNLSNNRQDTTAHPWGAVTFNRPGRPATLVVHGDPANARGQATYFTMRTPFAYLAATQTLDKEPLAYRTGERFQVRYLITLTPQLQSADAITARGKRWTTSLR